MRIRQQQYNPFLLQTRAFLRNSGNLNYMLYKTLMIQEGFMAWWQCFLYFCLTLQDSDQLSLNNQSSQVVLSKQSVVNVDSQCCNKRRLVESWRRHLIIDPLLLPYPERPLQESGIFTEKRLRQSLTQQQSNIQGAQDAHFLSMPSKTQKQARKNSKEIITLETHSSLQDHYLRNQMGLKFSQAPSTFYKPLTKD